MDTNPAGPHPRRGPDPDTGPADVPPCPFCGGERTELMSLFGSHASLTTCWCADCRSPFEFLRWRDAAPDDMVANEMEHGPPETG